jgi:hypothetical protein
MGVRLWGTLAVAAAVFASGTPAAVASRSANVWARPGRLPLSDRAAARLVVRAPEVMPENQIPNDYVPTKRELQAFYNARDSYHHKIVKYNPLFAYVTGRPGIAHPSTDDLVLWAAYKWGIPVSIIKAIVFVESRGRQRSKGDLAVVSRREYLRYPAQFRVPPNKVFQSVGITQVIWEPDRVKRRRHRITAMALDGIQPRLHGGDGPLLLRRPLLLVPAELSRRAGDGQRRRVECAASLE